MSASYCHAMRPPAHLRVYRVEISEDTKLPHAATIKVLKQDHTLANMLRAELLATPAVLFAGYKVPHPLQPHFLIKVQTDGTISPYDAVDLAANKLIGTVAAVENRFRREFNFKDVEGGAPGGFGGMGNVTGGGGAIGDDPYGTAGGAGGTWSSGKEYLDF